MWKQVLLLVLHEVRNQGELGQIGCRDPRLKLSLTGMKVIDLAFHHCSRSFDLISHGSDRRHLPMRHLPIATTTHETSTHKGHLPIASIRNDA